MCEYVVVVPVPPPPPPLAAVTVTALVNEFPDNEAVNVDDPAPTAVQVNCALACPLLTVTLDGTVATDVLELDNATDVFELTLFDMPTVIVCVLPGANETDTGVKDVNVAVE